MPKYKATTLIKLGSPNRLGRGEVTRYEAGDILDIDDDLAERLGRKVVPYREPRKTVPPKPDTKPDAPFGVKSGDVVGG